MFAFRLLAPVCASVLLFAGCGGGDSAPTGPAVPTDPTSPSAPGAGVLMTATSGSALHTTVAWQGGSAGARLRLERRRDDSGNGAAYALVTEVDAPAGVWLDSGLQASTAYTYRLTRADGSVLATTSVSTRSEAVLTTPAPEPVGPAQSVPVGPATRRLLLADGALQLDLPAGSLAQEGTVTLQPVSNPLPDGNGLGATLVLPERPATTLEMTLRYDADEDVDEVLQDRIAMQQPDGSWWLLPLAAHDAAQRTLRIDVPPNLWVEQPGATVQAARATVAAATRVAATAAGGSGGNSVGGRFVRVKAHKLVPASAVVRVLGSQRFVPVSIYVMVETGNQDCSGADGDLCIPTPILREVTLPILNNKPGFQRRWTLQGSATPDATLGGLAVQSPSGVVYTAPAQVPATNPLTLRFESTNTRTGARLVLKARVRVAEDAWTGMLESFVGAQEQGSYVTVATRWTLDAAQSTALRRVYRPSGTAEHEYKIVDPLCTHVVSPRLVALAQAETSGLLVVDESVEPPRYTLDLATHWDSTLTVTCPRGTASGAFAGGHVWSAQGVVRNGRIDGSDNTLGERSWLLGRPE